MDDPHEIDDVDIVTGGNDYAADAKDNQGN